MDKGTAYREILEVLEKHSDVLKEDYQIDISGKIKDRIRLQEISHEFGIELNSDLSPDWIRLSDHESIAIYGSDHNRTISWPDDGRQPENEMLYVICFPTGAYIFGDDYPVQTFNGFFNELKSYGAEYIDSANKVLYFTSATAKNVHKDFKAIFNKYRAQIGEELKKKRITALKEELEKLEGA